MSSRVTKVAAGAEAVSLGDPRASGLGQRLGISITLVILWADLAFPSLILFLWKRTGLDSASERPFLAHCKGI